MASSLIIKPSALKDLLAKNNKVVLVDTSLYSPDSGRNAFEEFKSKRLPGARYFDISKIRAYSKFPFMLPNNKLFQKSLEGLNIGSDAHVVFYDSATNFLLTAPRGAFTFIANGFNNVSVLDGGIVAWENEGFDLETTPDAPGVKASVDFYNSLPEFGPDADIYGPADSPVVVSYDDVLANAKLPTEQAAIIADARNLDAYHKAHIPHALSLPASSVTTGEKIRTFYDQSTDEEIFAKHLGKENFANIKAGTQKVICSCQGGVTAAITWLALLSVGVKNPLLYDESWTGYSAREQSIIATGEGDNYK